MSTSREIVEAYARIWNENDPDERARLLEFCWHPEGAIFIGDRVIRGRDAVAAEAARFRSLRPADVVVFTSDVAFVDRWFRFTAEAHRPDRSVYSRMLDVGEFAADGRIRTIVTFLSES
jgi:hypothetical protein